jgi:hypothetical protein
MAMQQNPKHHRQYNAAHCNTTQRIAMHHSASQRKATQALHHKALQRTTAHGNAVQNI